MIMTSANFFCQSEATNVSSFRNGKIAPILCGHSVTTINAVTISGEPDCVEFTLAALIADLPGAIAGVSRSALLEQRSTAAFTW